MKKRIGLHPAVLLAGGLHDFRSAPQVVANKPCASCGSTEPNAQSVERWDGSGAIGRWVRVMGCCGARRDS